MPRPKGVKGVTLIEMAIVLTLSVTLIMAFYTFLSSHIMGAAEESSEIRVQNDIRTTMTELVRELEGAHLYFLDPYGIFICYQEPQLGPNGSSFLLDTSATNLGNPIYGAYPFDGSVFVPGGYYKLYFVDHTDSKDLLIESALVAGTTTSGTTYGQDISGTLGGAGNTIGYDKGFVFGHFEVQMFGPTVTALSSATAFSGPNGTAYAGSRMISGKALRQVDSTDSTPIVAYPTSSTPTKRTYPFNGGFFYMRQTYANKLLNATGTGTGSVTSPQLADIFIDNNNNGIWDVGEPYTDINSNGVYDQPDCEPFNDKNFNNVYDSSDSTVINGATWHGSLRLQMRSYDPKKLLGNSPDIRNSNSVVRTITTKVKIRN